MLNGTIYRHAIGGKVLKTSLKYAFVCKKNDFCFQITEAQCDWF